MTTSRRSTRALPSGVSHGASALMAAWLATGTIALLTGATAVVILLAVGVVAMVGGVVSGRLALRGTAVTAVTTARLAVAGDELAWHVTVQGGRPVHVAIRADGDPTNTRLAHGWCTEGTTTLLGVAPRRGVYRQVQATCSSAGRIGLVWWRVRHTLTLDDRADSADSADFAGLAVAPRIAGDAAPVQLAEDDDDGDRALSVHAGRDEIDGVRAWREGDELTGVHWPSTLRTGEFVVRQRFRERDERWVVQAHTGLPDPALEAGRVRHSLERGLAAGAAVAVRTDSGDTVELTDEDEVLRWCAAFDPHDPAPAPTPWWRRTIGESPEPDTTVSSTARWVIAAASAAPMWMVLEPLGYSTATITLVLAGVVAAAVATNRRPPLSKALGQLLGLLAGLGVGALLIDVAAIDSVVASLRYLLPQLLVSLVVMQGFECTDRRGARVTLACAAVLTAYAAGIRVDGQLTMWLLGVVAVLGVASSSVGRPQLPTVARPSRARARAGQVTGVLVAAALVLAILAVTPVPRGPAQLTLPSWLTENRPTSGGGELAAPDGSPLLGGPTNNRGDNGGGSSADGSAGNGGYPGFSTQMDTSLRGDLGNQVVLRVRSPEPDYWRGQTFSNFTGRIWYLDDAGNGSDNGEQTEGPDHLLKPTDGDVPRADSEELIQTFYPQVDMANIVFAAYRPTRVLLNAPLWQRPDGALRADVVLPKGSAYTVVSQRADVTAELLRGNGNLRGSSASNKYLQLPDTTTTRTIELANRITADSTTTYDAILAIHAWLAVNVEYDLDAPVPAGDEDAVDDFLFESRRGFCEQIATATAIMLRSLGVPARIATGYVPSNYDAVAGVWISRASDAHAWVEVLFPEVGWVAFDPTANVPLAGESTRHTIGGDLSKAVGEFVGAHIGLVLLVALAGAIASVVAQFVLRWWRRRRRGRWGVLQDRFVTIALQRGAPPTATNPVLAEAFREKSAAAAATALATELDASAFSITWVDDDVAYAHALAALRELEHSS
ncbi:MAG: transglutaminaseTgpA domain-containing protein [Actinomycetota bacterium]|nr:transglutaminaseTgpA domain-containing protein [Actinomycetota bacterium]